MYAFFVTKYNDLDGLAPIAWRMSKAGFPVTVYRWGYDNPDYRLSFLVEQGIPVRRTSHPSKEIGKLLIFAHGGKPGVAVRKTIALPHGVSNYTDTHGVVEMMRSHLGFDRFVSSSLLGSARYCREWMEVHDDIYPTTELSELGDDKYRVGFNVGGQGTGGFDQVLENLDRFPSCFFALRPNLLVGKEKRNDQLYDSPWLNPSEIVDWCDMSLVTTSCYSIESFIKRKPTYHLRFCHTRGVVFDDICHSINSYEELEELLKSRDCPQYVDTPEIDKYISDVVYAGGNDAYDVLGAYVGFLLSES